MVKPTNFLIMCAGFLLIVGAFGQSTSTTTPAQVLLHLPPLGLAASEAAQVNVVNSLLLLPPNDRVASFCSGTVVFYDSMGGVVGQIRPFQLASLQMFSTPFEFPSAGASGQRPVILAVIHLSPFNVATDIGPAVTPCSVTASLETFDTVTGVTHAVATGTAFLASEDAEARTSAVRQF